jgi:hypothetical protein
VLKIKKLIFISVLLGLLTLAIPVFAASQGGQGSQGAGSGQQGAGVSSTGNQVQNQNQIQTQNQGEDQQLKVSNQEQENTGEQVSQAEGSTKAASPRSEVAVEKMSNVAQKVEELLTTQEAKGGIGDDVRKVAQEQKDAQGKIQQELKKVDNRGGLLKLLVGPDYKALKSMQKQMEQNQLRIQTLEQLKNQLLNQGELTSVQEAIQALIEQNTALQDRISLEEGNFSLLGWLFRLFA